MKAILFDFVSEWMFYYRDMQFIVKVVDAFFWSGKDMHVDRESAGTFSQCGAITFNTEPQTGGLVNSAALPWSDQIIQDRKNEDRYHARTG